MNVIKADYRIIDRLDQDEILTKLEMIGRVCYKSEGRITDESAETFIRSIINRGHESVLEHVSFSVRFIVDRGVSHEIVRHRIASFSQESTRYCNYSKGDFNSEITFIEPLFFDTTSDAFIHWSMVMEEAELRYFALLDFGSSPQEARSVLPNSLKTELIMTANVREWRHFLRLRTAKAAHPQMKEVTIPLLQDLQTSLPVLFGDIVIGG